MSKAERLVNLVHLLRNRGVLHVRDMAIYCEVNERTIYRDMSALQRMGIPLYYENGYRLMPDASAPVAAVSSLDLDLICLAVCNSTFTRSPYFRSRLKAIIEKLQSFKKKQAPQREPELVLYDRRSMSIPPYHDYPAIFDFLRGAIEHKYIAVSGSNGSHRKINCIPVAIRFFENSACLIVARDEQSPWDSIQLNENVRIKVTSKSFSRRPTNRSSATPGSPGISRKSLQGIKFLLLTSQAFSDTLPAS